MGGLLLSHFDHRPHRNQRVEQQMAENSVAGRALDERRGLRRKPAII
jgi:hypothetical protein